MKPLIYELTGISWKIILSQPLPVRGTINLIINIIRPNQHNCFKIKVSLKRKYVGEEYQPENPENKAVQLLHFFFFSNWSTAIDDTLLI